MVRSPHRRSIHKTSGGYFSTPEPTFHIHRIVGRLARRSGVACHILPVGGISVGETTVSPSHYACHLCGDWTLNTSDTEVQLHILWCLLNPQPNWSPRQRMPSNNNKRWHMLAEFRTEAAHLMYFIAREGAGSFYCHCACGTYRCEKFSNLVRHIRGHIRRPTNRISHV